MRPFHLYSSIWVRHCFVECYRCSFHRSASFWRYVANDVFVLKTFEVEVPLELPMSCLCHVAPVWAGFSERTRDGNKFVVAEKPARQAGRNFSAESVEALVEERKSRRENGCSVFDDATDGNPTETVLDSLFID